MGSSRGEVVKIKGGVKVSIIYGNDPDCHYLDVQTLRQL
jgi:hypothetical protein